MNFTFGLPIGCQKVLMHSNLQVLLLRFKYGNKEVSKLHDDGVIICPRLI